MKKSRKSFIKIGPLQCEILTLIRDQSRSLYGAEVQRLLAEKRGREVSIGMIYRTLELLLHKRLVSQFEDETIRKGRPRLFYTITKDGLTAINDFAERLREGK